MLKTIHVLNNVILHFSTFHLASKISFLAKVLYFVYMSSTALGSLPGSGKIFLSSPKTCRPVLESAQIPIQGATEAFSWE